MLAPLNTLILYARQPERTAAFYALHFGYRALEPLDGVTELCPPEGSNGVRLLVLQAAKSIKLGHVGIKLVFSVADVEAFKAASAERGLHFGSTHTANGYCFANAKDPDGNSVSVSSRAFRPGAPER